MSISFSPGDICPVCEMGVLSREACGEVFYYKGQSFVVDGLRSFTCVECGESFFDSKEEKRLEKLLTDKRREIDGLLTSQEIKSIRKKIGYTQRELANFLGVGEKNFARYETGASAQSKAMDNLLKIMRSYPDIVISVLGERKNEWARMGKVIYLAISKAKSKSDVLVQYSRPDGRWACQNE